MTRHVVTLLVVGLLAIGCASEATEPLPTPEPPSTEPSSPGKLRLKRFELQCPEGEMSQIVHIDYAAGAGSNDPEQALRVYLLDKAHLPSNDEFLLAFQRPNRADFIYRDADSHIVVIARANRLPGGWVVGTVESCTGAGEEPVVTETGQDAFDN